MARARASSNASLDSPKGDPNAYPVFSWDSQTCVSAAYSLQLSSWMKVAANLDGSIVFGSRPKPVEDEENMGGLSFDASNDGNGNREDLDYGWITTDEVLTLPLAVSWIRLYLLKLYEASNTKLAKSFDPKALGPKDSRLLKVLRKGDWKASKPYLKVEPDPVRKSRVHPNFDQIPKIGKAVEAYEISQQREEGMPNAIPCGTIPVGSRLSEVWTTNQGRPWIIDFWAGSVEDCPGLAFKVVTHPLSKKEALETRKFAGDTAVAGEQYSYWIDAIEFLSSPETSREPLRTEINPLAMRSIEWFFQGLIAGYSIKASEEAASSEGEEESEDDEERRARERKERGLVRRTRKLEREMGAGGKKRKKKANGMGNPRKR